MDELTRTGAEMLRDAILEDLRGRSEWAKKQTAIFQRRLGSRPKVKTYPYKNAPNFVVPVIDDAVREKTDQEVSMLWNAPRIAHAIPLSSSLAPQDRAAVELFFDSYVRYIIKARRTVARAMDAKNAQGFAIIKVTRRFNRLLNQAIPDIEHINQFDLIVPVDTQDVQDAERITEVVRLSERQFMERAQARGWQNAEAVWQKAKRSGREERIEEDDYFEKVKELVGLATSPKDADYVVVWVTYHYATEDDVAWSPATISPGDRIVTVFSPDCPEYTLSKYPWRDNDVMMMGEQGSTITQRGTERPWPYVQCPYEDRSPYYYDQRGGGELCMDDQLEATASKNAKFVLLDYYQNPILRGASRNPQNVRFAPGTTVESGVDFLPPPPIPPNFDFSVNDAKANAAKRLGAGSMYNYTTDMGSRKLQKTASEVVSQDSKSAGVSSAAVDLFNEPLSLAFQMLWDDMRRMNLVFPAINPESEAAGASMNPALYSLNILFVPASSAKTLNPDMLLQRQMAFVEFLTGKMQAGVPVDLAKACRDVAAQFDSRLTRDWIIDPNGNGPQGQPPIYDMLAQINQNIQMIAQGGKDLEARITNLERLAVTTSQQQRSQRALPS